LEPIALRTDELLYRDGERLVGPWNELIFNGCEWIESGEPTDLFETHMEFLRTHGISGGVCVPNTDVTGVFYETVRKMQSVLGDVEKALILMHKDFYDRCKQTNGLENVAVYLNQKSDPPFPRKLQGVVLCHYNQLDKLPAIVSARWDILMLVGPDDVFKTNRSMVFANTKKISARIRLGLFSLGFELFPPQQQIAIAELFRYDNLRDQTLWQYLIRDVSMTLPLPKHYVFVSQAINRAENPVTIELGGIEEQRIAIPERHTINTSYGSVRVTISSSFESRSGSFRTQAEKFISRSVNKAIFEPFMSYWPTYGSMSENQQQWYFHWRTNIRMGHYIQTDLSYIFVYVYELINGIGYSDDGDGLNKLIEIWNVYRPTFPKLDNYLPD
jgi:hypothetical protein